MAKKDYIWHVTLTTGHGRRSPRSEVSDQVVAELENVIDWALHARESVIPGRPGYTINITDEGRCMIATIYTPDGMPLVTIGVAAHSLRGAAVWRMLHETGSMEYATSPNEVPGEPWCAVRLDVGLPFYPEAAAWLGDFERCLAWAWMSRYEET
ncbi:MAG TPA: hypothetical protein VN622_11035 [Clostridia bacterium]|nr:hypothetical protein [Clostridia bacterium]